MCEITKAKELIKQFEGLRLNPYFCAAGRKTVGYGSTVAVGDAITPEEAENRLSVDVNNCVGVIERNVRVPLNENQKAALISLVFNIGGGAFQSSTLRQKLNRKEYVAASREFVRWNKVKGKELKGLTKRRIAEKLLFDTPYKEVVVKNVAYKQQNSLNLLKKAAAAIWSLFSLKHL